MALRSSSYLKSKLSNRLREASTFATSTAPRGQIIDVIKSKTKRGDFVPVAVALGMIMLSASFGVHAAMQQLKRSPNVHLKKSRRETIPEVVEPEHVVEESQKFIQNSFFRKLAHIKDSKFHGDILPRQPHAGTLKHIGVDPKLQ